MKADANNKQHLPTCYYWLLIGAVIFIWAVGRTLPNIVASHFNAAGQANGFMPRSIYLLFMYTMIVGVPFALMIYAPRAFRSPNARINIPHRDYWLAPIRREETLAYLSKQPARFAALLVIFLCYVHWLVALANRQPFPIFPQNAFFVGLGLYLITVALWALTFVGRFRKIPR